MHLGWLCRLLRVPDLAAVGATPHTAAPDRPNLTVGAAPHTAASDATTAHTAASDATVGAAPHTAASDATTAIAPSGVQAVL